MVPLGCDRVTTAVWVWEGERARRNAWDWSPIPWVGARVLGLTTAKRGWYNMATHTSRAHKNVIVQGGTEMSRTHTILTGQPC